MWRGAILAISVMIPLPAAAQAPADEGARFGAAIAPVLQANAATGRERLLALTGLSESAGQMRACILDRLDPVAPVALPEGDAAFADRLLHLYRVYWKEAANSPPERVEQVQERLRDGVSRLLGRAEVTEIAEIERLALERVRAEGHFGLGGRTGLLRDMMIWSRQDESDVEVALPEGPHTTKMFLLSEFKSRGWSTWLTCGATGTGGWAKPEGLYGIAESLDLDSESFKASFLGHETQHFADYAAWPGLPGRNLEYRAKLTELSLAEATLADLLRAFDRNQSDNESDAHSHANKRVLAALRARLALPADADLGTVDRAAVREAARQELFADTARRRAAAAAVPGGPDPG